MERSLIRPSPSDDDENQQALEVRAELKRTLALRGERRLQAILDSPAPATLVRALAPVELFYTYSEVEEEGKRSLVRLLAGEQVDYLLDLDLWHKDRIDPGKALSWLERLFLAGTEQAVKWVLRADTELLVTVLRHLIAVSEGPTGSEAVLVEAQDSLPPFTAEGIFYVHFKFPETAKLLKELFILVAGEDMESYMALLQDLNNLTQTQSEEAAYEQRWRRLKDEGFLPPDEAYEVYASMTDVQVEAPLERAEREGFELDAPVAPDEPAPTALALAGPTGLIAAAVEKLSDGERAELSWSLVTTGAQILSADHLHLGDLAAHRAALRKSLGYVTIGLESRAEGNVTRAKDLLVEMGARNLFRAGYSLVAALGFRATDLKRQSWLSSQTGLGLEILDEPLEEVIRVLARPRPLYPARALSNEGENREFQTHEEVLLCAEVLDRAEALRRLFIDGLGLDLAPAEVFDLTGCEPAEHNALSLGLILRTAVANLIVEGQLRYSPIAADKLPSLVGRLSRELDVAIEDSELHRQVFEALGDRIESPSEKDLRHVDELVSHNLAELFSVFGGLEHEASIDTRFVGAIVVKNVRS